MERCRAVGLPRPLIQQLRNAQFLPAHGKAVSGRSGSGRSGRREL